MFECPISPPCSDLLGPYDARLLDRLTVDVERALPALGAHNGLDASEAGERNGVLVLGRVNYRAPQPLVVHVRSDAGADPGEIRRRLGSAAAAPLLVLCPAGARQRVVRVLDSAAFMDDVVDDFGLWRLHEGLDALDPGYRARRVSATVDDLDALFDDLTLEVQHERARSFGAWLNGVPIPGFATSKKRFRQLWKLVDARLESGGHGWVKGADLGLDEHNRALDELRGLFVEVSVDDYAGKDLRQVIVTRKGHGAMRLNLRPERIRRRGTPPA